MYKLLAITALASVTLIGCKVQSDTKGASDSVPDTQLTIQSELVPGTKPLAAAMPAAIVYKTRADYRDKVPVNIDGRTGQITGYPDPCDLHPGVTPLPLTDGYLLDRRGITPTVAFTSYTYEEYSALKSVPSREQLKQRIIDRTPLVAMYRLPMSATDAEADTAKVNQIIRNGFAGCTSLILTIEQ
ncbi:MAG: hypothetical protein ACI4AH_00650 [Muribaculaceae bacterium]